ncbi:MAG: C4-dicarboxylate ABC transporter permease [Pusillimonas sp.]|nr:C4-dicarboxylate ABC transporter permease [Pusillimonas sp.]MBC40992.1 C4-dicarboxylate ABC transporter permease [Pusillimonas sp.]HCP77506.1 C4-dicarboxylate ABC transporter permease [Pusillimonas sp.]|tara:strand:- start:18238 stop:18792 length:555 start_codon:yes stop_codon:yes gene_type:complete
MLHRFSTRLAQIELGLAGFFALLVTVLIIYNVITRAMDNSQFWVDEAAIFAMIWMLFLGTSVLLKQRKAVAVTALVDVLPRRWRRIVGVFVDLSVLLFGVLLLVFCWKWYAPLDMIQAGFDKDAFSAETFNFMYQEKAVTLPMYKFWAWLIVPYFALSLCFHTLVNLINDPRGHYMDESEGQAL